MMKLNLQFSLIKKVLVLQRTEETLNLRDWALKERMDSL